jgi:rfaE bifunctional protein kinase chain/domain
VTGPVVVIGDLLLDRDVTGEVVRLSPDAPVPVLTETSTVERPGGAGLAAMLLARDGLAVVLVCAAGADPAGRLARSLLRSAGVELVELPYSGPTPEKVRFISGTHQLLRMERGTTPGEFAPGPIALGGVLDSARAVLVSDYGRGVTGLAAVRRDLAALASRTPVVWDPHPRGSTPLPGAVLVCPNRREAAGFCARHGAELHGPAATDPADATAVAADAAAAEARLLRGTWHAHAVAVTLGGHGAVLADSDHDACLVAAPSVHAGDTCGAGDRFAATATAAFATGASARQAVGEAVARASHYVSAGGPAALTIETTRVEATA